MKILLDECIPFPLKDYFFSLGYEVEHVKLSLFEGLKNGELYEQAKLHYNIFVTNDKHFKHPLLFPPASTLGIIYLRIAPNHSQYFIQGLNHFLSSQTLDYVIGKKVIIRRNDFEFVL
ncbi:MAG: DUF5615 family PIN-like protein [Ignavibacteriales bacterium]|nr:DUF5615 family PIN-like protein [Ignavibacteriales bacterium]